MQGSVLGPVLQYFYALLTTCTPLQHYLLFSLQMIHAVFLQVKTKNLEDLIKFCTEELQKIANWFSAIKLAINVNKCKYIIFNNKGKKIPLEDEKTIFYCTKLVKTTSPKILYPLTVFILMLIWLKTIVSNTQDFYQMKTCLSEITLTTFVKNYLNYSFAFAEPNLYLSKKHYTLYFAIFHSYLLYCANVCNWLCLQN